MANFREFLGKNDIFNEHPVSDPIGCNREVKCTHTEKDYSPEYILKYSKKNPIFNECPVCNGL